MKDDIERFRQLSLRCRELAILAAGEETARNLVTLAEAYDEKAFSLFRAQVADAVDA